MKTLPPSFPVRQRPRPGFTLIELLVSTAILSMLLIMVFQMLKGMQTTWKRTRQDVGEFKDARQSFEEITRRVSQATLNTYFTYRYDTSTINGVQLRVGREIISQSELHFVCGPVDELGINTKNSRQVGQRYTHAVFFQAPFGFCIDENKNDKGRLQYEKLNSTMNAWGYFIEFNTDELDRPQFLNQLDNSPKPRPRYRLMEFRQPTEYFQVYKLQLREMDKSGSKDKIYQWFTEGNYSVNSDWNTSLTDRDSEGFFRTTRVVAENIIAMILHPREADEKNNTGREELAPDYVFDSRRFQWEGSGSLATRTRHQLPPVIDITFVAIDESSFNTFVVREGIKSADDDPKLIEKDLFKKVKEFRKDLDTVEAALKAKKLDYRIFNTSMRIRESKWVDDKQQIKP
ncbi:MAG TPA: Verru_Chthon cassette protein C [Verrucomicrobiales bacterium]|nr:Verru_Chthon cassette protein C [Verrucomicrobiales bacterium]